MHPARIKDAFNLPSPFPTSGLNRHRIVRAEHHVMPPSDHEATRPVAVATAPACAARARACSTPRPLYRMSCSSSLARSLVASSPQGGGATTKHRYRGRHATTKHRERVVSGSNKTAIELKKSGYTVHKFCTPIRHATPHRATTGRPQNRPIPCCCL